MTTGESTCSCCSPVRTVIRSTVDTPGASGCGDATGWTWLHATATPAASSAAPVRYMDERDMVGLEEGECLWYSRLQRRCQAPSAQPATLAGGRVARGWPPRRR